MSGGELAVLLVGIVTTTLLGIIAYFLSSRFDEQQASLDNLTQKVADQEVAIARLTEAQKAVVTNQTTLSRIQERLVEESNDLEDVMNQLQDATNSLRRRWEEHVSIHEIMTPNTGS